IDAFHGAFERLAAEEATTNFYILASYIQGLVEIEAARRAIEGGDISRAGYLEALRSISDFDARGLLNAPIDLTQFPYITNTDARVLQPGTGLQEWTVVSDYATPQAYQG
ncbi:MAG: hypothetical protein HY658_05420, partial [Actinobacteria bacterium]|nr:hypothetical protein [Actinomycetota bacterium]